MAVENIKDDQFQSAISGNSKVIVKYYADWCGSCKLFAPKFRRLSDDDRFAGIAFLDVNAEQSPEARKAAGVDNLPFFAIFRDGKLVEGTSTSREEVVVEMLDKLK